MRKFYRKYCGWIVSIVSVVSLVSFFVGLINGSALLIAIAIFTVLGGLCLDCHFRPEVDRSRFP